MTYKRTSLMFFVVLIIAALIACGGGNSNSNNNNGGGSTPPVVAKARAAISLVPGSHIFAKTTTVAYKFNLVEKAFAQTTTVSLSQSMNGVCNLSPDVVQTVSYLVYGLGQTSAPNCSSAWYFDTVGSGAAASAQTGQRVIGNGTLSNLVVWTSTGTAITSGTQFHLWIRRGSQVLDTAIGCTISQGNDYLTCSSTTQYQAMDGDLVIATVTKPTADKVVGLNVLFTKA